MGRKLNLWLGGLLAILPFSAIGQPSTAARLPHADRIETTFTTVSAMENGTVVTMTSVFANAAHMFSELGIAAPAVTQAFGDPPETPPPPAPSSVPNGITQVTYQMTSPGWVRSTTYSRPVNYNSNGTYTTGTWRLENDSLRSTGGGSCHGLNVEDCPESVN